MTFDKAEYFAVADPKGQWMVKLLRCRPAAGME